MDKRGARIETTRLNLIEAAATDAAFFVDLMNTEGWKKNIGTNGPKNLTEAKFYIESKLISSYRENRFGLYIISLKPDGTFIGLCGLVKRPLLSHPDLGFALLPDYSGNGFAEEAARASLLLAKKLQLQKIQAICSPSNLKSIALLEKIGFEKKEEIKSEKEEELFLYEKTTIK